MRHYKQCYSAVLCSAGSDQSSYTLPTVHALFSGGVGTRGDTGSLTQRELVSITQASVACMY
jgi:hypothetical protein